MGQALVLALAVMGSGGQAWLTNLILSLLLNYLTILQSSYWFKSIEKS